MDQLTSFLDTLNGYLYGYGLAFALIGVGLLFTVWTRFGQLRLFPAMWRTIFQSRTGAEGGISSFQAFCIGLASRVGTGNIVGVAVALTLGGPGAVFWMWVVALLGMASAMIEATLAQLYKQPHEDGSFRGGPATYIERGMKARWLGMIFAVSLIFTYGFAFNMVQANTIAVTLNKFNASISPTWGALVVVVLTALVIFGGLKSIARVTEWMAPIMAAAYVLLALIVIVLNLGQIGNYFADVFAGAFGLREGLAGTAGGLFATFQNGVKRGLFSNEAGMGSAPNAAATATTSHPVNQGLIQSLGVFVDTILVCTATSFMILLAGKAVYTPGTTPRSAAGTLTTEALQHTLGGWVVPVMTLLIFVFAYSSIIGNFSYAEVNLDFIKDSSALRWVLRILVVVAVGLGAVAELPLVWNLADTTMVVMTAINLIAMLALGKYAIGAIKDFTRQGSRPSAVFDLDSDHDMPAGFDNPVWHRNDPIGHGTTEATRR